MHRLSRKFQLIPTSRYLRLCEYIPRNQKGRQAAIPGLRTAKMQTGVGGCTPLTLVRPFGGHIGQLFRRLTHFQ
jgi:hypothetical protein